MSERVKLENFFDSLPDDEFGVLVLNDEDRLKLIWLVNQIGESKLRRAAKDFLTKKSYPPYVSTISRRFNRKVPLEVYMARKIPVYRVYCIVTADKLAIKIGYSGDWIVRVSNLPNERKQSLKLVDLNESFSVLMPGKSDVARALEQKVLKSLRAAGYQISPPPEFDRHFSVKKEWFSYEAFEEVLRLLLPNGSGGYRSFLTLSKALRIDLYNVDIDPVMH